MIFLILAGLSPATSSSADWLERSGLDTSQPAPRLSVYAWPDGAWFSGVFTDHAVLQRSPQSATVYGVIVDSSGTLAVPTLKVSVTLHSNSIGDTNVAAQHVDVVNKSYARWKAVLPPTAGGTEEYSVSVTCSGCGKAVTPSNFAASTGGSPTPQHTLNDILFGDVYICSGQSNMWLPVHFSYSRNATFNSWLEGKYHNIRLANMPKNSQPDDAWTKNGYDFFIAPPTPPGDNFGAVNGGGWKRSDVGTYPCAGGRNLSECSPMRGGDEWFNNTIDQFSAACWYFAETLTDMMVAKGEAEIPFGLIESNWGGTMVEMWQPNASINAQACKNASGGAYAANQLGRWDIDAGSLWNGMVLPLVNYSIRGVRYGAAFSLQLLRARAHLFLPPLPFQALWYQGENNVFQCRLGRDAPLGNPKACGDVTEGTGYGCFMQNLVKTWRTAFSSGPVSNNTTPSDFPFGIVSLAGGTSEGFGKNMGAFRLAQAGGTGLLPNGRVGWANTFVAQAFDLGEAGDGVASTTNRFDGQGPYATKRGAAPHTSFFMGGIHPRPKRAVGSRLAHAARHFIYGDTSTPFTGPVLTACDVKGSSIELTFDPSLLAGDALAVRRSAQLSSLPLATLAESGDTAVLSALLAAAQLTYAGKSDWMYTSPLEVQYGGTNLTNGVWLPAMLAPKCSNGGNSNLPGGKIEGNKACGVNTTTGQPLANFNIATATLPLGRLQVANVTGLRYAFRDYPCCPGVSRDVIPCPPASCPLGGYNSSLPAVPFVATIVGGSCKWISITATTV